MTIKELETRSGLDRTAIRFYEKEGLLAPKRLPNGYRDYSEEDALTLEKIALLRQLDLSLEDIRAVQSGEVPLPLALRRQEEALRDRQAETARALAVSRAIQQDGASYLTLQPAKYQAQLPPPATSRLDGPQTPAGEPAAGHAWLRYLARHVDLELYMLLSTALALFAFGLPWNNRGYQLLVVVLSLALMAVLEPLLLSTWGWTPGKWLMGLRLRDHKGRKLEYGEAFVRTLLVLAQGMGANIPILSLVCQWKAYRRAVPPETVPPTPPQDQPWDETDRYTVEGRKWRGEVLGVLAWLALLGLQFGVMLVSMQPNLLNRPVDTGVYVKSVNHLLDYNLAGNSIELHPDGTWSGSGYQTFLLGLRNLEDLKQTILEQDGLVTSVTMEYPVHTGEKNSAAGDGTSLKWNSIYALLGGQPGEAQTEQLSALFRAGKGTVSLEGWTVRQEILDKPADFAACYHWKNGDWLWDGETIPDPIPRIRFTIIKQ